MGAQSEGRDLISDSLVLFTIKIKQSGADGDYPSAPTSESDYSSLLRFASIAAAAPVKAKRIGKRQSVVLYPVFGDVTLDSFEDDVFVLESVLGLEEASDSVFDSSGNKTALAPDSL